MTHWYLISKIKVVKDTKRAFVPRRKIGKLRKDGVKSGFNSQVNNYSENREDDDSVVDYFEKYLES